MEAVMEAGDTTKAMSYIEKIDVSLRHTCNTIRTGNLVVDEGEAKGSY